MTTSSGGSGSRAALAAALVLIALATPSSGDNRGVYVHLGDSVTSALQPVGDADEYVFDALEGAVLTVSAERSKGSPLVPAIGLLDPAGTEVPIAGALKERRKGDLLKKLTVPSTGRYLLRISDRGTAEGGYRLKTKQSPPKGLVLKNVALAAGEVRGFRVGGETGTVIKAVIKAKKDQSFEVVSVLDPEGNEVPGGVTAFAAKAPKATAKLTLSGGFGDYTVRIGNAPAPAVLSIKLLTKHPKRAKRKLTVDPNEPRVTGVFQTQVAVGDPALIEGSGFVQGAVAFFAGTMAPRTTVTSSTGISADVPEGVQGDVEVSVRNPDGQENGLADALFVFPPEPDPRSVDPTAGTAAGGTTITVTGSHFADAVSATLGGVDVTPSLVVVSDTELRLTTPPHAGGASDLTVTDRWGRSGALVHAFTFGTPYVDISSTTMPEMVGVVFTGGDDMALGDLDGDDDLDLVLVNEVDERAVFRDGFRPGYVYRDRPGGFRSYPLRIHLNDGTGDFTKSQGTPPAPVEFNQGESDGGQGGKLRIGDLDGDDDLDLVVSAGYILTNRSSIRALMNDGDGNFAFAPSFPAPSSEQVYLSADDFDLGDLDDDGDLDAVVALWFYPFSTATRPGSSDFTTPATRVLFNDGTGVFTDRSDTVLPDVADADLLVADSVALGDLDNDGSLDMVITTNNDYAYETSYNHPAAVEGSLTRVLMNDGDGNFTNETASLFPSLGVRRRAWGDLLELADLNGDSYLDIVIADAVETRIFLGSADGFTEHMRPFLSVASAVDPRGASELKLEDIDGDGDVDILLMLVQHVYLAGSGLPRVPASSLRLLKNDGNANFTDVTGSEIPSTPNTEHQYNGLVLALGDVDGDDDTDILVTHSFLDRANVLPYQAYEYSFYGTSFWRSGSHFPTRLLERK